MKVPNNCMWNLDTLQALHTLGNAYGWLLKDRHVLVNRQTLDQHSITELLSFQVKSMPNQREILHSTLATLKLVWKPSMRAHRNGWRKVMHERLSWQKVSSIVYDGKSSVSFKGLVLPLYAFLETEACYGFVAAHIPNVTSVATLIKSAPLPDQILQVLIAQMAISLHTCHRSGVLLRSLHRNSFIIDSFCNCLLADFQCAKLCEQSHSTRLPLHTIEYLSPEQINSQTYGRISDWFSLGILALELCVGSTPLQSYCKRNSITLPVDQDAILLNRPSNDILISGK